MINRLTVERAAPVDISQMTIINYIISEFRHFPVSLHYREGRRSLLMTLSLCLLSGNNYAFVGGLVLFFHRIWVGKVSVWNIYSSFNNTFMSLYFAGSFVFRCGETSQSFPWCDSWEIPSGKNGRNRPHVSFSRKLYSQVHTLMITEYKCILFVTLIFYHLL